MTSRSPPGRPSLDDPVARLNKVLAYERERGYANTAVMGGLNVFLTNWLKTATPSLPADVRERAGRLVAAFADYGERNPAGRRAIVEDALSGGWLTGPPSGPAGHATTHAADEAQAPDGAARVPRDGKGPSGGAGVSPARVPGIRAGETPAPPGEVARPREGAASGSTESDGRAERRPRGPSQPMKRVEAPPEAGGRESELAEAEPVSGGRRRDAPRGRLPVAQDGAAKRSAEPRRAARARPTVSTAGLVEAPISSDNPASDLMAPVEEKVRGIGSAYQDKLQRLGIRTVYDLLYHFPRYHLDYRAAKLIRDLSFEGYETLLVNVWKVKVEPKPGGLLVIRAIVADESGTAEALWFRRKDYVSKDLTTGRTIVLSGECRIVGGRPVFKDPEWESYSGEDTIHTARLVPVYPLVEGLGGRQMRRIIKQAVDRYASLLQDHLAPDLRQSLHLMDLPQAIAQAHFPDSDELKESAQRRLAFDEWLLIQLGVRWRRRVWETTEPAPALADGADRVGAFLEALPFQLTGAQGRAVDAVRAEIARTRPMNLLLEGDVGSGKTVVATAAMVQAAANGYQSAIMAPTEILAEQHLRTVERLLAGLGGAAPRVTLLTGAIKGAERRERYAAIREGKVDVVIGTQALIQEELDFRELGLVVVDEQHRFGVAQRSALRQKGYNPHVLVMTATPIPRTLALTLYGDLDLAVIDELPPGRQTIKTRYLPPTYRPRAYEFVRREVQAGHQAFVICPLVAESERTEARAATEEYERLRVEVFPDLRLGLLHGRMKPAEKEEVMRRFQARDVDVLVSTAVVEVGIDVPNATVMLVEGANRFGLAQLHQFRGRVGRGDAQSYCLLLSDAPSAVSDQRLTLMEQTSDGFKLAEADLQMRGPGEFFGTRQSGLPNLKMASFGNLEVVEQAREAATHLYRDDPRLSAPEHRLLRQKVARFWQGQLDLN